MSAELNVQLRLQTDQLRNDASKAAAIVEEQLNKTKPKSGGQLGSKLFDGWGKSLLKFGQDSTKSMNWFDSAVKRATIANNKFSSSLNEFKKYGLKDLPKIFGAQSPSTPAFMQAAGFFKKQEMQGPDLSGKMRDKFALEQEKEKANQQKQADKAAIDASRLNISMKARQQAQAISFQGRMSSLAMPMFNPSSPWANFVAGRQVHSAMSSSYGKDFLAGRQGGMMGQAGGILGKASGGNALIATGILVAGAAVIGSVLSGLQKAISIGIEKINQAILKASDYYKQSILSGYGLQTQVKRTALSNIIGVSEKDLSKFANAVVFLDSKIKDSVEIIKKTTTPLTETAYNFKVLKFDIEAMFSKIAFNVKPAVDTFINNLDKLVKYLTRAIPERSEPATKLKQWSAEGSLVQIGQKSVDLSRLAMGLGMQGATAMEMAQKLSSIKKESTLDKLLSNPAKTFEAGGTKLKFTPFSSSEIEQFKDLWNLIKSPAKLNEPTSVMQQMPASTWEKMGLVIGGGRNTTNELIKEGNKHLSAIAKAVTGDFGIPRSSFGINPTLANP